MWRTVKGKGRKGWFENGVGLEAVIQEVWM